MDTVPAFPVRDMPIALHFVPVQLSRKIGYHCPGEHGLSLQLNCHDQTDTDPSAEGTPPPGIDFSPKRLTQPKIFRAHILLTNLLVISRRSRRSLQNSVHYQLACRQPPLCGCKRNYNLSCSPRVSSGLKRKDTVSLGYALLCVYCRRRHGLYWLMEHTPVHISYLKGLAYILCERFAGQRRVYFNKYITHPCGASSHHGLCRVGLVRPIQQLLHGRRFLCCYQALVKPSALQQPLQCIVTLVLDVAIICIE